MALSKLDHWPCSAAALAVALMVTLLMAACGDPGVEQRLAQARSALAQDDVGRAQIEVRHALDKQPDSAAGRLLLGRVLLERADPAGAIVEFQRAERGGAAADDVLPWLARAHYEAGEWVRVVGLGDRSSALGPAAAATLKTTVAEAQLRLGQPQAAAATMEEALRLLPEHVAALLLQARLQARAGDLAAAASTVERTLKQEPGHVEAQLLRASLGLAAGDKSQAQVIRTIAAAHPRHVLAQSMAIELLIDERAFDAAQAQLEAFHKARGAHPMVKYMEALLAYRRHRLDEADVSIKQLVKFAPDNPSLLSLAAQVASARGELGQAERHLVRLLQVAPGDERARRLAARVALERGDPARAQTLLQPLLAGSAPHAASLALAEPEGAVQADVALIAAQVQRGNLDAALAAADRMVAHSGASALALNLRGQLRAARGAFDGARADFEQALVREPGSKAALEAVIQLDLRQGKAEQARARLRAAAKANPKSPGPWLALAGVDGVTGRPRQEVVASLAKAVALEPTNPALRMRQVRYLLNARDTGAALAAARDATVALPDDPEVLDALGAAQLAAGDWQQAGRSYNRLATIRPNAPEAWLGLARLQLARAAQDDPPGPGAHLSASTLSATLAHIGRALAQAPESTEAYRLLLNAYQRAGREAEALALAQGLAGLAARAGAGATAGTVNATLGHEWLGDIERQRGRPAAAVAPYRAALRLQPHDSSLAIRLHGSLVAAGQGPEAAAQAQAWLAAHPRDADFLVHLGALAVARQNHAGAETHLRAALAIRPEHPPALNNLAWLLARAGKRGAVELAEKAAALVEREPQFLDTLAFALAADGKLERALQVQKKAVEISRPADPALRLQLARLLLRSGDRPAARRELELLQRAGTSLPQRAEVEALLSQL